MQFFKSKRTFLIILIIILFLGFFLRFYRLGSIPNGPEWDEASVGYNAFSIAKTGHDEWGNKFPLIFAAFGDYKNPLYIYSSAAVVRVVGLNIISTRFINALTGGLFILVWYFIADLITKNKKISLLTAFLVAISPFGIFFSRIAGDGMMLSVFLVSLGLMFECFYLEKKKPVFFISAVFCLLLSIFAYNLARIISPILILLVLSINFNVQKNRKIYIPILLICSMFFLVVLKQMNISLKSRLQYVGIMGNGKGVAIQIAQFRGQDKNSVISKVTHNKLTMSALTIVKSYVGYFSSQFLLGFNDNHLVFESQYPPLFMALLPFYYLGIVIFVKELFDKNEFNNKTFRIFILTLLFIAPLPAVIAEGVSGKRSLALLGVMQFMTAYGIIFSFNRLKNISWGKISTAILAILILINMLHYLLFYFYLFPQKYGVYYASREKSFCRFVKKNYYNYDYFIYSRQIDAFSYIFPLFCLTFPPDSYSRTRSYSVSDGWYTIKSYDKFLFPDEINTKFVLSLANKKGKNIAIFLDESENNYTFFSDKNFIKTRLPISSEPNGELYLYKLNIL